MPTIAMSTMPASVSAQKPILVYTTNYCFYCLRAKRLLSARGYAFTEIDVSDDSVQRAWLVEKTKRRTVPQVFIDGRSVGGYDEIAALDRRGELARMVRGEP